MSDVDFLRGLSVKGYLGLLRMKKLILIAIRELVMNFFLGLVVAADLGNAAPIFEMLLDGVGKFDVCANKKMSFFSFLNPTTATVIAETV